MLTFKEWVKKLPSREGRRGKKLVKLYKLTPTPRSWLSVQLQATSHTRTPACCGSVCSLSWNKDRVNKNGRFCNLICMRRNNTFIYFNLPFYERGCSCVCDWEEISAVWAVMVWVSGMIETCQGLYQTADMSTGLLGKDTNCHHTKTVEWTHNCVK